MGKGKDLLYLLFAVILTVLGFLVFKLLLSGQAPDYATEISAAVFGGLLTIVITGVLLQKQSEVDMKKDRNAKMLEAKLALYEKLMEEVGKVLAGSGKDEQKEAADAGAKRGHPEQGPARDEGGRGEDIMDHLVAIQVLNQRLAVLGSKEVVVAFSEFASRFARAARDGKLNAREKDDLLDALGKMSIDMHVDLLAAEEKAEFAGHRPAFEEAFKKNIESLRTIAITQQGFLDACDERERDYFGKLIVHLEQEGWTVTPRTSGLTVTSQAGAPLLWCFPSKARRNIELLRENIPADVQDGVRNILGSLGIAEDKLDGKRVTFKSVDVSLEELKRIMGLIKDGSESGLV